MIDVQRTMQVRPDPERVLAYLEDFSHAEQWDPGTVSCTRQGAGPVTVGSRWHNVSKFRGRETELTYELVTREPRRLTFVGKNRTATSTDDITVEPAAGGGSTLTYRARIEFHGLAKLAGPLLSREFDKLADATEEQLTKVLDGLA